MTRILAPFILFSKIRATIYDTNKSNPINNFCEIFNSLGVVSRIFIGRRPFNSTLRFIQFIDTKFCLVVNYKLQQCNGLELTSENGTCFSICCETDFQLLRYIQASEVNFGFIFILILHLLAVFLFWEVCIEDKKVVQS